jgi:hypothetical protein
VFTDSDVFTDSESPQFDETATRTTPPATADFLGERMLADVYPSRSAAVDALADVLPDYVRTAADLGEPIEAIIISSEQSFERRVGRMTEGAGGGRVDEQIMSHVQQSLSVAFPNARVVLEGAQEEALPPGRDHIVRVHVNHKQVEQPDAFGRSIGGEIAVTASGRARSPAPLAPRYLDKPWVEQFDAFRQSRSGRDWLLAASGEVAVSEREAQRQAMDDAVRQLEPMVANKMPPPPPTGSVVLGKNWLRDFIRTNLQTNGMIADRFTQRIARPYGATIHREHLLLEVSEPHLAKLAGSAEVRLLQSHRTSRTTLASMVGLLVVITVVYLVLNSITKGYYTGRLRAAGMAVLVIAAMLAVAVLA